MFKPEQFAMLKTLINITASLIVVFFIQIHNNHLLAQKKSSEDDMYYSPKDKPKASKETEIFTAGGNEIPPMETTEDSRNYYYEETVNLDTSFTRAKQYKIFKNYIVSHFNSSGNVIQLDDAESGVLIAKVYSQLPESGLFIQVLNEKISYTVTIKFKDGKYKYRFDNFSHSYSVKRQVTGTQYSSGRSEVTDYEYKLNEYKPGKKILKTVHTSMLTEIESLKKAITLPKSGEDW